MFNYNDQSRDNAQHFILITLSDVNLTRLEYRLLLDSQEYYQYFPQSDPILGGLLFAPRPGPAPNIQSQEFHATDLQRVNEVTL